LCEFGPEGVQPMRLSLGSTNQQLVNPGRRMSLLVVRGVFILLAIGAEPDNLCPGWR